MKFLLAWFILALWASGACATDYYVSFARGVDTSTCGQYATPCKTITYGYESSNVGNGNAGLIPGDRLLVEAGTYTDYDGSNVSLFFAHAGVAGAPITIQCIVPLSCILDGSGHAAQNFSVVEFAGPWHILNGFKITKGDGGGIKTQTNGGNEIIENCEIYNNGRNFGSLGYGGNGILEGSTFITGNNQYLGNFIHDNGSNTHLDHGIYADYTSGTIANNVITNMYNGMGIQFASNIAMNGWNIYNNTISNTGDANIIFYAPSALNLTNFTIKNNIFANAGMNPTYASNGCNLRDASATTGINFVINSNVFYGGNAACTPSLSGTADFQVSGDGGTTSIAYTMTNEIQSNPLFQRIVNTTTFAAAPYLNNFHTLPNTPALGTGTPIPSVTTDFAGSPRASGPGHGWSIGAYQIGVSLTPQP